MFVCAIEKIYNIVGYFIIFLGFWILARVLRESVSMLKELLGISLIIWIAFWIAKASAVNMLFKAGNLNL